MSEVVSDAVLYSVDKGVATLTLNRPDSKNALTIELLNALGDGLTSAMASADARLVVLTNNGNTFCAGANLRGEPTDEPSRYGLVEIFELMLDGPKPVVGMIAGHCMGGGVGLAAACEWVWRPHVTSRSRRRTCCSGSRRCGSA
jgi:methylglutaconyl-CoA hydratase